MYASATVNCAIVMLVITTYQGITHAAGPCSGDSDTAFINAEKNLLDCLLTNSNYDPRVRPVQKPNDTVNVLINIATMRVADIDEKNQLLKMRGWIFQQWKDPKLTWTPQDYDNIYELRIPINSLWHPDLVLYNYAETVSLRDESHSEATVLHDGTVIYTPLDTNIKTSCPLNMRYFPYDKQSCWLAVGSATNAVNRLNISVVNTTTEVWYEGHEWKILDSSLHRQEHVFDTSQMFGSSGPKLRMAMAVYMISLERNPVYYQHVFVIPTVLLVCVTLLIYLVPPEAKERLTLCGAVLIGTCILLLMLENHLPTEVAQAPLLLRFLLYTCFMNTCAMCITVLSLNFYHRDIRKAKVPDWMRRIFLGKLTKYLGLRLAVYNSLSTNEESVFDVNASELEASTEADRELFEEPTPLPRSPTLSIEKTMDEIRRYLRILAARTRTGPAPEPALTHRQIVVNEWHQVGLVIDRLAFVCFSALTVFIAIVMALA